MLAVIHFLPGLYYIGAAIGGVVAGWLAIKEEEKQKRLNEDPRALPADNPKKEEKEEKSELRAAVDALNNLHVKTDDNNNDDDNPEDGRFGILDFSER